MDIHLSRLQTRMPKCSLDILQVSAAASVMRGERVTQRMNRGAEDTGLIQVLGDHFLNGAGTHRLSVLTEKQPIPLDVGPDVQVGSDRLARFVVESDRPG